jgi:hypothetical protein
MRPPGSGTVGVGSLTVLFFQIKMALAQRGHLI